MVPAKFETKLLNWSSALTVRLNTEPAVAEVGADALKWSAAPPRVMLALVPLSYART
jgi:hypothetical protein